jgi:hypothetical protein
MNQPNVAGIFDKHVELSTAPSLAGVKGGEVWLFDGKNWKRVVGKAEQERLFCLAEKHGAKVHFAQWDFPAGFDFNQECGDGNS